MTAPRVPSVVARTQAPHRRLDLASLPLAAALDKARQTLGAEWGLVVRHLRVTLGIESFDELANRVHSREGVGARVENHSLEVFLDDRPVWLGRWERDGDTAVFQARWLVRPELLGDASRPA